MSYEPETMTYDGLLGGTVASGVVFLVSLILVAVCGHRCRTDPSEKDRACCCACCFRDDEEEGNIYGQDPYEDSIYSKQETFSRRDDTYHSNGGYGNGYTDVQMSQRSSRVHTKDGVADVDDYYSDY